MNLSRVVAITILPLAVLSGLFAFAVNVITYVRPVPMDAAIAQWREHFSRAAYGWCAALAAAAVVTIWTINVRSGGRPKYEPVVAVMGLCWFFAIVTGTFLSPPTSLRFKDNHWELGGRFQHWHPLSESEARAQMWLKLRTASAMVVAESATVFTAGVLLLGMTTTQSPPPTGDQSNPASPSPPRSRD